MTWNPFKKQEEAPGLCWRKLRRRPNDEKKGPSTPKDEAGSGRRYPSAGSGGPQSQRQGRQSPSAEKENAEYEAMQKGDINHMPKAERLPWRIYIRDYVDARFNLGEWFIPVAFGDSDRSMFHPFSMQNQWASIIMMALMYGYLIAVIIDVLRWKCKAKLLRLHANGLCQGLSLLLLRVSRHSDEIVGRLPAALPETGGHWQWTDCPYLLWLPLI